MAKRLRPRGQLTMKLIPTKGVKFDTGTVTKQLRAALAEEARVHRAMLKVTTDTWLGPKPRFASEVTASRKALKVRTGPTGYGLGAKKWMWLERGTSVRWALMSRNWQSKTMPGYLGSGGNPGRVVIVGKRAMMKRRIAPRPGIKPRNWIAEVVKARTRPFLASLRKTFDIIAKNIVTTESARR